MVRINLLRISLLQIETFSDLVPRGAPFDFFLNPLKFKETTSKKKRSSSSVSDRYLKELKSESLEFPWYREHYYWIRYLETSDPEKVKDDKAWKYVVPLRCKPGKIKAPWLSGVAYLEGYYYPHCVATIITVNVSNGLDLMDMVNMALEVRYSDKFDIEFPDARLISKVSIADIARETLKVLHKTAIGENIESLVNDPFTVTTIIQGKGVDQEEKIEPGGDIHKALEALCTWNREYDKIVLNDTILQESEIELKHTPIPPPGQIHYGRKRGRVIWHPSKFKSPDVYPSSLKCYHRNIVFSSLQTEALAFLLQIAEKYLKRGEPLPGVVDTLSKRAAALLGNIYWGKNTYRSWSPRQLIDDMQYVEVIKRIREHHGQDTSSW